MGIYNCAPLVADFFVCYERYFVFLFMKIIKQMLFKHFCIALPQDIWIACLILIIMVYRLEQKDELWYILDNRCFEQMASQIYPIELQLNNANSSDTEGPFFVGELPCSRIGHRYGYTQCVYARLSCQQCSLN